MAFGDFLRNALPGLGTVGGTLFGGPLGGVLGGLGGGLLGNLFGPSESPFQQQAREAQMGLLQQLQTPNQFNAVNFSPIREQELQRFQTQTIPGIAERFTGAQGSSGFRQALGQAGSDLGSRLAALESQHLVGQQGAQQAQQGINLSRLGQLQGFLNADQQRALQQQQAQQSQIGNLLNLGMQSGRTGLEQQAGLTSDINRNIFSGAPFAGQRPYEHAYFPQTYGLSGQLGGILQGLGSIFRGI